MGSLILKGSFNIRNVFGGEISIKNTFNGQFGQFMPVETTIPYTGEYIVVPKVYEQTLETAHKVMADDVKVLEIPYHEVSNPFNGITVTIGG